MDLPPADAVRMRQRILKQHQTQTQTRTRMRQQKLRMTFLGYVVVLVFFAVLQLIGVGFFTLGFLLLRQVLPEVADCSAGCVEPTFDRAILLVVDALRFDFVIPVEEPLANPYYHNNLGVLHRLALLDRGLLLKFMADPPTTTLQRLKGLTTGLLPTFIDAGLNFDGDAIDEDNWLLQMHRQNRTIAFMGDDTWTALFEHYIDPSLNFPFDLLNVGDLHTVDNGVIRHMMPLLEKSAPHWDLLIGHFLGVDHVGHRYGPNHFLMKDKLHQMDEVISDVVAKMDDKTLLVVIGDHGMDSTGNHGGDSPDELESALFMYSKNPSFRVSKKDPSLYSTARLGRDYRSVNQIDLVPTMAMLLGLPIPYNNLGFPIDEAFGSEKALCAAANQTVSQIHTYRSASNELRDDRVINDQFHAYAENHLLLGSNSRFYAQLVDQAKAYQHQSLDRCKELWAQFDLVSIGIGIGILFLSLSFIIIYSRSIPAVRVLTMSFEFIGSVIAMTLLGLVVSSSIYVVLRPVGFSLKSVLSIGLALGITVGFWAPIMDRFSVNWLVHLLWDFFVFNFNSWSFLGIVFVVLHCLVFASNSYVVWEDKMVLFFISTFGVCCLYACCTIKNKTRSEKVLGILHAVTFVVLSRFVIMINLCREEQRPICTPTFTTTWWSIALLHALSFILPVMVRSFYELSNSYHSAAPLWIGTGLKFLLFMNAIYWTFEYVERSDHFQNSLLVVSMPLLKSFKLAIARIVLFITLVLANFSWSRGPLCVKLEQQVLIPMDSSDDSEDPENEELEPRAPSQKTATILGFSNVYGSSYFLLVINFTVAIMLVTKPLGAISISVMLVQVLSLLEMFDLLEIRRNLVAPVMFALLGYQHFFSTGHQATLPSIQWEVGFMTTETIVLPFTHLNIVLNTFGSFIIMCLCVPLITLWKVAPSNKPITALSQIITNVTTVMSYQTLTSISSLIFAAHFRRHLMVWKIFAPRFMLSGLLLMVLNVTLITLTLWFGTGRVLTQVNRIFGK